MTSAEALAPTPTGEVWPGRAYPLGATYDGAGTNFALFSEVAERVELCLFDADGAETRVELPEVDGFVWHGFVPGIEPGQRYGYRVHGPYEPGERAALQPEQAAARPVRQGHRRHVRLGPVAVRLHTSATRTAATTTTPRASMPKSVVINPFFDWGIDRPPQPRSTPSRSSTRRTSRA